MLNNLINTKTLFFFFRYIPLNSTVIDNANLPNMENTSVFALSGFQYIIMAVVVTKGYPHKKPLYHNGESSAKTRIWDGKSDAFRQLSALITSEIDSSYKTLFLQIIIILSL